LQQHLDAITLETALQHMCWCDDRADISILDLLGLPAAAQLSSSAVERLLLAVFEQNARSSFSQRVAGRSVYSLCQLPAAAHISNAVAVQVLEAAMKKQCRYSSGAPWAEAFCSLPAVQLLSTDDVASLLQAGVGGHGSELFRELCRLPAAAHVNCEQVVQMLQETLLHNGIFFANLRSLLELPAAEQISSKEMQHLLHIGVASKRQPNVSLLCCQPAAAALSSDAVARLLATSAQPGNKQLQELNVCAQCLCELPGAQQVTSSMLLPAVQAAVENNTFMTLMFISQLPAAKQFTCDEVQPILQVAVELGHPDCVCYLSLLPAAQMLGRAAVEPLVQAAAQADKFDCKTQRVLNNAVSNLPAARELMHAESWQEMLRGLKA
jgi:hypothetical protein